MKRSVFLTLAALCLSLTMSAQTPGKITLPKLISDKMVLQRDVELDSPGTGHEFQTWRRSLLEMAPMLFK